MAGSLTSTSPSTFSLPQPQNSIKKPSKPQNSLNSLSSYLQTLTLGTPPTKSIFISVMKSCSLISSLSSGQAVHAHIIKSGFQSDRFIATSVIAFYSSKGRLLLARQLFDRIPHRDPPLLTAMLLSYVESRDIGEARVLFDGMCCKDVIAWNAMLTGYLQCGLAEKAVALFREMLSLKVVPNEVTLICALSACSQMGCSDLGVSIHAYAYRHFNVLCSTTLNNSLVHMYSKCGNLDIAFALFQNNESKNLESWNTMLTGFSVHGRAIEALSLFSQMTKTRVQPDRISFIALLTACSHTGMVDHARSCFNCMTRLYGIEPDSKHYNCIVDALSRGGHLAEARMLIESMPFEADACAWGSLLSGCLRYCNYELGLDVAEYLLEMEPREEGRFIALLNLYTMAGRIEDATKLRKVMVELGVEQSQGCSMIEVDAIMHEFTAGDRSHLRSGDVYAMVHDVHLNLDLHSYYMHRYVNSK